MKNPLLVVENLSVHFQNESTLTTAVKSISFTINAGETVAIVGESGSGKSLTALSLMQLLPARASTTGQILFSQAERKPVNISELKDEAMRALRGKEIAMIFQEPMTSLNPVFTCGFQVAEAIQLHQKIDKATARQRAVALFEEVQLPDPNQFYDKYPHQISGGQKQRVMIAMAMSSNPALLIADEPTTALDVTVQKNILDLIKKMQVQYGMSVLLITHDLGVVADVADKIMVMYKGEIIEQGNTAAVLAQPQHQYTKALLACRPAGQERGVRLPVVSDFFIDRSMAADKSIAAVENVTEQLPNYNGNPDSPILKVENLSVVYPGKKIFLSKSSRPFKAVDDVSFFVKKGQTLGVVGESGCGKTTLGKAIIQLIKPTSGNIILNGINLAALSSANMQPLRKELQIVFQDPYGSLNPRLTIGNAIQEPMQVHGLWQHNQQRKEKVMELLKKVNLQPADFNKYPHQFSGGQRQRICIARALALNPSFLIFDESVSALDVSVQAQILNLLNDLKRAFDFTSIFISHDLSVVRYISDEIMVMKDGKIIEQGAADDVYFHPQNEYTQKLIEAIPGKGLAIFK